jgi:esterase/lipase superfamily enzyme
VPQITQAYITSRLESVSLVLQNSQLEDMLDNEEQLSEQMDALPYLVGEWERAGMGLHVHAAWACMGVRGLA